MKLPNGERAIVDIRKLAGILPEFTASAGSQQSTSVRIRWNPGGRCRSSEVGPICGCERCGGSIGHCESTRTALRRGFRFRHQHKMIKIRNTWIVRIEEDWPAAHELLCLIKKRRYVMSGIEMHSVVALTEDLPDEGLGRPSRHCGRVSNSGNLSAAGDQGGLPTDSDAYCSNCSVISAVDFQGNPSSGLRHGIIAGYPANRPEAPVDHRRSW
jgi:hypothetical protein